MLSYWERTSFLQYDHIVVGAGITGLSTALELKSLYPNQRVLVLERGIFPLGASTRNAGFACMGSVGELLEDLEQIPENEVLQLCAQRQEGLRILRRRLGDNRIDFHNNGSHELITPRSSGVLDRIDWLNGLLKPLASMGAVFRLANEKIKPFGFNTNHIVALIENTEEGELHTGKMMRALTDLVCSKGIEIKTGVSVTRFNAQARHVEVFVSGGPSAPSYALACKQFFICTNAFALQLLPDIAVQPGRGQVMVTAPVSGIPFKGIFHLDRGYYYFREIDDRVLIGGGRNLDFEGEKTTKMAVTEQIQSDLENKLHEMILPGRSVPIEYRWAGIMAFGQSKRPIIQSFGPRVHGAFRFGGMGIALSSLAAKQLVSLAAEH